MQDAVTGWDVPSTIVVVPTYTTADYARDAEETLRKGVREALGPDPDIPLVTRLVQKRPARALVEEAEEADLLVIGRHGSLSVIPQAGPVAREES